MASESTKDPILDLLFEELEPEEREALRAEVEGDPEQAEELESFELLMGRVRDADLVEEVPSSVHASIMEAARAGAARNEVGPRGTRRGPNDSESLWSRFASGGTGQIALVATVLVAAAFVYQVVGPMGAPGMVGDSAEAPLSQMQPNTRSAAEADEMAEGESEESVMEEPELAKAATESAEESVADEIAPMPGEDGLDDLAAAPEEETLLGAEAAEPAQGKLAENREPAPKRSATRRARKLKSSANLDLFGGSESAAPSPSSNSASGVTSTRGAQAEEKGADYLSIDDVEPKARADKAAPEAPAPDDESDLEAEQQAYAPPSGSPAAIQQSYDERDYTTTLREANQYLGDDGGTATDRATVMQLKAASLSALGRYSEADRVYQNIQRSYPSFRPAQIKEARADIARQLSDRKRRQKPTPKKQMDSDSMEDQLEMAPSSLD